MASEKEKVGSEVDFGDVLTKVVEIAKKPYVDPEQEALKATKRLKMREKQKKKEENQKAKESNCAHLRQDGSSGIAWMQNSDFIVRGFCPYCQTDFDPTHPQYSALRMIPTRAAILR